MRFVKTDQLREGMILARPLFRRTDVMLARGVVLNERYINSIRSHDFPGAYIDDALSADIEIEPLISDSLRIETTKKLAQLEKLAQFDDGEHRQKLPDLTAQIEDIVSELSRNREVMVNISTLSDYDSYTYTHSLNVCLLSVLLGSSMGMTRSELIGLGTGSLLHDMGKINVSAGILQKNGPLNNEEFEEIKKHPQDGYDYISKRVQLPAKYMYTILDHHEKYSGGGYPNGKQGSDISLYGRICSVADVYDALSSKRPYRDALPIHECVEYIMGNAFSQFDPDVVEAFTRRIAPYPVGTSVTLSNGWVALVLENYSSYSLRPRIRVYQQDGHDVTPFDISLKDDHNYLSITISGVV